MAQTINQICQRVQREAYFFNGIVLAWSETGLCGLIPVVIGVGAGTLRYVMSMMISSPATHLKDSAREPLGTSKINQPSSWKSLIQLLRAPEEGDIDVLLGVEAIGGHTCLVGVNGMIPARVHAQFRRQDLDV